MALRPGNSVIVVGAGVVGVCTAYALARAGLRVTVLDRHPTPAAETSFANGAQLSYAYSESIADPASLRQLLGWLFRPESPVILKHCPRNLAFADWAWRYLRAAMPKSSLRHSANLLRLGLHSRQQMQAWLKDAPLAFDHQENGILYLYRSAPDMAQGRKKVAVATHFGFEEKLLTPQECIAIEPCLAETAEQFIGAVHSPMDATGDPYLFSHALAKQAAEHRVAFLPFEAEELVFRNEKLVGVRGRTETLEADAIVLAAGSYTPSLMRSARLPLPLQPMKGYSLTFDAEDGAAPQSSITDVSQRLVHTRIGQRVRVAGFAEFAGYDSATRPEPLAQLRRDASRLVPRYRFGQATEWACLRAATPDGLPVIGQTSVPGLWLNTGHGMLGWTQAAGSADLLTRLMLGQTVPIPMEGYAYDRF